MSSYVRSGAAPLPVPHLSARYLRLEQLPVGYSVEETGSWQAPVYQCGGATAVWGQTSAGPHQCPQQPRSVSAELIVFL